jgi:hypothetical protein
MRKIYLSKSEFDNILYPAFVSGSPESEDELEVAVRLKFLFKKNADYEEISAEETIAATKRRERVIPFLKLRSDTTFTFEEDEFKLLHKRLVAAIPRSSFAIAEEMADLLSRFKKSEKVRGSEEFEATAVSLKEA